MVSGWTSLCNLLVASRQCSLQAYICPSNLSTLFLWSLAVLRDEAEVVCTFVRHEMWPRGTPEPKNINFVDKVSLYVNFRPNRQRSWPHFQGQRFESNTVIREYLQNDERWEFVVIANNIWSSDLYLHLILIHSKDQGRGRAPFHCDNLVNGER